MEVRIETENGEGGLVLDGCMTKDNFYKRRKETLKAKENVLSAPTAANIARFSEKVWDEAEMLHGMVEAVREGSNRDDEILDELLALISSEIALHAYGRGDEAIPLERLHLAMEFLPRRAEHSKNGLFRSVM